MRRRGSYSYWSLVFLSVSLAVACSDEGPTAPDFPRGPGFGMGPPAAVPVTPGPLSVGIGAAMERAILDEYQAEAIYSRVLEDFGNVIPFANVVYAEMRHSESIARVLTSHEMPVPEDPYHRDDVPRFRSIPEACAAAAIEEEKNIAMYDDLLRMELPGDVEQVFTMNRRASLEAHLPAFRVCAGG